MIHLVGLPHTEFDAHQYSSCAFTAKAVRTVRMWRQSGHDVTVYWGGNRADVSLLSHDEQLRHFGTWCATELPKVAWDPHLEYWQTFHAKAISEIRARLQPGDIIAGLVGSIHQQVFDSFPNHIRIEPGVGYEGLAHNTFACFESYAWMHNRYGACGIGDGRAFDIVIPNAVDPDDWDIGPSVGYALFVGRHIARKGPHVAAQIANAAGLRLVTAGAGVAQAEPGRIVCTDKTVIEGDVSYVGSVTGQKRRDLFAGAQVLICPTLYIGPWEGVHAEAMMSGVGVVAPDYGVFVETLPRAYRYRSLSDAVDAVHLAGQTRGISWRDLAIDLCGIDRCARQYDDWFDRLASLNDGRNGWYS